MAPLSNYMSTEVLLLDVACNDIYELGRVLWSITVDLYHHRDEWTLTCLAEEHGRWESSYRRVSIQNSTTIGQLLGGERLIEPPSKEVQDSEGTFGIAVTHSVNPTPRIEGRVSDLTDLPESSLIIFSHHSSCDSRSLLAGPPLKCCSQERRIPDTLGFFSRPSTVFGKTMAHLSWRMNSPCVRSAA